MQGADRCCPLSSYSFKKVVRHETHEQWTRKINYKNYKRRSFEKRISSSLCKTRQTDKQTDVHQSEALPLSARHNKHQTQLYFTSSVSELDRSFFSQGSHSRELSKKFIYKCSNLYSPAYRQTNRRTDKPTHRVKHITLSAEITKNARSTS